MKSELKSSISKKRTLLVLSIVCVLSASLSLILGDIFLPVVIGCLSLIILFDFTERKLFGYIVSGLLVALNIAGLIFKISFSLFSIQSIIIAFLIVFCFVKEKSKAEASYVMMLICALFTVLSALFFAMAEQGDYSVSGALDYYTTQWQELGKLFAETTMEIYEEAFADIGLSISSDEIYALFDQQKNMIISYLIILSFAIIGLSFKLFSAVGSRLAEDNSRFVSWRFTTTNVYAYFYIILIIASMFASSSDGIIALTITNLYNVFLVIYAYVGFNLAIALLTRKMRSAFAIIIIFLSIVFFPSFAIQLLALLGVLSTIRKNNEQRSSNV